MSTQTGTRFAKIIFKSGASHHQYSNFSVVVDGDERTPSYIWSRVTGSNRCGASEYTQNGWYEKASRASAGSGNHASAAHLSVISGNGGYSTFPIRNDCGDGGGICQGKSRLELKMPYRELRKPPRVDARLYFAWCVFPIDSGARQYRASLELAGLAGVCCYRRNDAGVCAPAAAHVDLILLNNFLFPFPSHYFTGMIREKSFLSWLLSASGRRCWAELVFLLSSATLIIDYMTARSTQARTQECISRLFLTPYVVLWRELRRVAAWRPMRPTSAIRSDDGDGTAR